MHEVRGGAVSHQWVRLPQPPMSTVRWWHATRAVGSHSAADPWAGTRVPLAGIGRLVGVELDDTPPPSPLQCISARIWSVPLEGRTR